MIVAIPAVPPIVQRASKAYVAKLHGYVGMQRHFTTDIKGGVVFHSEQSDSGVLLHNGYFAAAQYYRIARDGKVYDAKQIADRTKQTDADWLAGKVFFKEPYDPRFLRDYSFAESMPCAACRSGTAVVTFSSSLADTQHGRGTMWIDRATGRVSRLTYSPNALPQHATSGSVTETGGAALPGLWYVVRIDETYHGHVLILSGVGTFTGIFDHFRRFSTAAAARFALSSKTI
jgi:hypothetical protein